MPVQVTVTGDRLSEIPLAPETLMRELGTLAMRLITTRTERMVDVNGAAFRPLSASYAKAKTKAGLPAVPNLQVSGRMLNDMALVEVGERVVTIGFTSAGGTAPLTGRKRSGRTASTFIQRSRAIGAADKAFFHSEVGAGRSQVKREFFGLSEQDEDALATAVEHYLDEVIP